MTTFRCIWVATLLLLTACSEQGLHRTNAQLREAAEAFVPADATDKLVAPGIPWVQLSFNVRRPWLEFAVDENRIARARSEGWRVCGPAKSEWESYWDEGTTPPRYERHKMVVLYKAGTMLTLIGMYDGPEENQPIQQGVVISQSLSEKAARAEAAKMLMKCE